MNSLWFETLNKPRQFPQISNNLSCDVCIVGGGIFGITCAYYLTKQGFNVILLEKDEIASKATGNTTAKITSQHGLFYSHLINDYGHSFARNYLEANEKAIENIKKLLTMKKSHVIFVIKIVMCMQQLQKNYKVFMMKLQLLGL